MYFMKLSSSQILSYCLIRRNQIRIKSLKIDFLPETYMTEFKPKNIVSDHGLPQFNSSEALKICLARKIHIPFIVVSGNTSIEFKQDCMIHGADDYILKSQIAKLPAIIIAHLNHSS